MVILWVNIRVGPPPSWNSVFGTTWLRFSSRSRFRTRARNLVGPRPDRHRLLQILTCNQYMMTCSKSRYHTGNLQKIKKQLDVHLSFRFAGRCALDSFQQVPVVNQVNVWGWNFPNACGFKTYHSCRISYFSLDVKCTAVYMCMMLENQRIFTVFTVDKDTFVNFLFLDGRKRK